MNMALFSPKNLLVIAAFGLLAYFIFNHFSSKAEG